MEQVEILDTTGTKEEGTPKENEDLKWTANRKDWPKYWIPRLAESKENLPKNIQELVEKLAARQSVKRKGRKMAELARYITERLDEINKKLPPETVKTINGEAQEIKQEIAIFNQTTESQEKANELILNQKLLPFLSFREQQDIKMSFGKKGALKYWLNRLAPELDILRSDIKEIVEKNLKTGKGPSSENNSALAQYVRRRIAITKFGAEKRMEMASLKTRLKQIDERAYEADEKEERKNIYYKNNEMLVKQENGKEKPIAIGDLVGDSFWDIKYDADESLPPALWRKIQKLIALKEARSKIENIFNTELAEIEGVSLPTSSWTYEFIEKHADEGVLAERIAQSLLSRVQYNNKEFGIKIESSNALEDAELKYDFKIILPEKKRGIAMEGDELPREAYKEKKKKLGVQFTVSQETQYLKHKQRQIEKARNEISLEKYRKLIKKPVDEIVLVSVPLKTYSECFKKWLESGKPSGGPEQYLSREEKIKILIAVTKDEINFSEEGLAKIFPAT